MAIQDAFRKIGFFEDFYGIAASATVSDGTAGTQYNDITIIGVSSNVTFDFTVDESGGVASFVTASGANDAVALTSSTFVPSSNGTIVVVGRWKISSVTDYRIFFGWQETVSLSEPVNPFTLSGTTLTANNGGQVAGFYFDTQATVDDVRFMASSDGTASTTAALSFAREGSSTLGSLGIRVATTPTNDRWMMARVEIDTGGTVRGYFGDETMGRTTGLTHIATLTAGGIDADAVYHPMMFLGQQSGAAPTHEVDYFGGTGNRDWSND